MINCSRKICKISDSHNSYSFFCESYLHVLLSLACIIPYYMYYTLLVYTFNLFLFLIRSMINHWLLSFIAFLIDYYSAFSLLQHGDIELNPGLKYFPICCWNLNRLVALNYLKVSQIQAFNLVHKFDIFGISETSLISQF